MRVTFDEAPRRLPERHDGYCFHPQGPDSEDARNACNPYGLMCAPQLGELGSWWYGTCTPTFLIRRICETVMDTKRLVDGDIHVGKAYLMNYRAKSPDLTPFSSSLDTSRSRGTKTGTGSTVWAFPTWR